MLLNHLVGACKKSYRYGNPESLRGLEIGCQPKFGWEFDGQVTAWNTLQNFIYKIADATITPAQINSVADEAAVNNVLAISEDGR